MHRLGSTGDILQMTGQNGIETWRTTVIWQTSSKYSKTGKTLSRNSRSSSLLAPDEIAKFSDASIITAPVSPPICTTKIKQNSHLHQKLM